MTPNEFRGLLAQKTDRDLLGLCLRDDTPPFVFDADADAWSDFRGELKKTLAVNAADVRIVGSARLGFSLKPHMNLQAFRSTSDIDLVVVSDAIFDEVWHDILAAAYPREAADVALGGWIAATRRELFTGWLSPLRFDQSLSSHGSKGIKILRFKARWFDALKKAGQHAIKPYETMTGRLYRTWGHVELYHLQSLASLRESLEVE